MFENVQVSSNNINGDITVIVRWDWVDFSTFPSCEVFCYEIPQKEEDEILKKCYFNESEILKWFFSTHIHDSDFASQVGILAGLNRGILRNCSFQNGSGIKYICSINVGKRTADKLFVVCVFDGNGALSSNVISVNIEKNVSFQIVKPSLLQSLFKKGTESHIIEFENNTQRKVISCPSGYGEKKCYAVVPNGKSVYLDKQIDPSSIEIKQLTSLWR